MDEQEAKKLIAELEAIAAGDLETEAECNIAKGCIESVVAQIKLNNVEVEVSDTNNHVEIEVSDKNNAYEEAKGQAGIDQLYTEIQSFDEEYPHVFDGMCEIDFETDFEKVEEHFLAVICMSYAISIIRGAKEKMEREQK